MVGPWVKAEDDNQKRRRREGDDLDDLRAGVLVGGFLLHELEDLEERLGRLCAGHRILAIDDEAGHALDADLPRELVLGADRVRLGVALKEGAHAWTDFYADHAKANGLTDDQIAEVAALVATNAMYNTFFKFRELSGSDLFGGMPVGLRAHTFHGTSFDDKTVELINVAISDLNACKPCVSGHVKKSRDLGLSDEAILETIQCAAVAYAGVQFTKSAET